MKASEALALAIGILKKRESLTIERKANAASAFQNPLGWLEGICHSMNTWNAARAETTPTRR
jgi:hypothetical protein